MSHLWGSFHGGWRRQAAGDDVAMPQGVAGLGGDAVVDAHATFTNGCLQARPACIWHVPGQECIQPRLPSPLHCECRICCDLEQCMITNWKTKLHTYGSGREACMIV